MPDIIAGKYEVLETIGRGGMGTVYKARQTNLDRIVAIKMLSEELAADPEFRARFQQEATVVARLNHPNIVQVHDIETHKNTFCIIMEFVDGENVQQKIDRDVTLPDAEVMDIGAQVARALAYAHTRGIIHRDIKPDNIHVTPRGIAKVMDFGIARYLDSKLKTQTGISMGTPKFMSPEQVTGKNVDGQTDLYSLGVCLYYCLTGRPPFDGENAISVATRHLYEQPELPSKINPSIAPQVEAAVLKAMEKQKNNRYKTGVEMAEALEAAVGRKFPTPDDNIAQAGGVTVKMPAQTFGSPASGGAVTTPGYTGGTPASSEITLPHNATPAEIANAAAKVSSALTSTGSVPEFDSSFGNAPTGTNERSDQNFQRALMVFGGLVFLAVVLLIVLVIWLRTSDTLPGFTGDGTLSPEISEQLETVEMRATELVRMGNHAGARELWLEFQDRYPNVQTQLVLQQLQQIDGYTAPDAPSKAERRYQLAFEALNNQERAIADAYLRSAINLAPELRNSALTTSTLQNLERKLSLPVSEVAKQTAVEAVLAGRAQMNDGNTGPETRRLLVQAVETNYSTPATWEALGDFFTRINDIDSAYVMYSEAVAKASTPEEENRLASKLVEISQVPGN